MANLDFTLRGGRRVGVTTLGDPAARRVVVFCHPAPGSSAFDPDPTTTERAGVHVVGLDRPGYGASEPLPADTWATVAQAADDIAEYLRTGEHVAESIGGVHDLGRVGVVGWAAGGRVALALAARHPDLVERVAVVATPAPQEQVPWVDEVLWHLAQLVANRAPAEALHQFSMEVGERWTDAFPPEDPLAHVPLDILGAGRADGEALGFPGIRERLDGMLRDAFVQGVEGFAADILSFMTQPWGFDPRDVTAPALLVYGGQDALVSPEHARWYAAALPNSTLELVPGGGHLVLVPEWRRILDFVAGGRP